MYTRLILTVCALFCLAVGAQAQTSVALSPVPAQQFFSQAGVPLASGCVFTYITGTSTPLATYTDGTGTAQNTNPIILDGGGFGNIWLSNSSYRFQIFSTGGVNCASGVLQRTVDNVSAYTIINQSQNIFLAGAASDPFGSAGELAYRTDIPCFRGFSTFWDCFITRNGIDVLTNKTLTTPAMSNPNILGTVTGAASYSSPTLLTPAITGQTTGTGVQGTDTKLLSSGTVAGTGIFLCTDALGGATTAGCVTNGAAIGCTAAGPVTISANNALQTLLSCTIPANTLIASSMLRVDVTGINSTASVQTISINTSLGGGTPCATTSATTGVAVNQPWHAQASFSVLTVGAGGTGNWACEYFAGSNGGSVVGSFGVVGAPTISINTTVVNTLLIQEQMSVNNAGNSVTAQLLKAVVY